MTYGVTEAAKTAEQLSREEVVRQTLEGAARRVEQQAGNETYARAWKRAAELIRAMKP
jgi:hypothetical protein